MHSLSTTFVLGYHGCSRAVGEKLLKNVPFKQSQNDYDWLGEGIYFWEANPDRALLWAQELAARHRKKGNPFLPFVVGAVVDLGLCLDLISTNGIQEVKQAHKGLVDVFRGTKTPLPVNSGGSDLLLRRLDRAVIQYLHEFRKEKGEPPFDTIRAVFTEAEPLYEGSGSREDAHSGLRH